MFLLMGKIALVTGGGSGLGLYYIKQMLRNGLKGATIADIDPVKGQQAVKEIIHEFGQDKIIFIKTDVSVQKELRVAFEKTVEVFNNLDIVINNAGIVREFAIEETVAVNLNGTIYGCLLAWDYLQKHRSGAEGVIVNISSITGLQGFMSIPIYSATKHAVIELSQCLGVQQHYDTTKIRIVTLCPGVTLTAMIETFSPDKCLSQFKCVFMEDLPKWPLQQPDIVAKALIEAITTGTNGSFWIIDDNKIYYLKAIPEILGPPK